MLKRLIAAISVAGFCVTTPLARAQDTRVVEVKGRQVFVQTAGLEKTRPAGPIVVFEAGFMEDGLSAWTPILGEVAKLAPVVAYDRAGIGGSVPDGVRPTPEHVAENLHDLLGVLGAAPPYVLVGHSLGGPFIRMFTALYPNEVAGLVYIDPTHTFSAETQRLMDEADGLSNEDRKRLQAAASEIPPDFTPSMRAELEVYFDLSDTHWLEFQKLPPMPDIPVSVLMAARFVPRPSDGIERSCEPRECHRRTTQVRMAWMSTLFADVTQGTLTVVTNSGHFIQFDDPALVVAQIRRVLKPDPQRGSEWDALIARAKSLEINTPYVPPPGEALEHHTSGFAKIMCSAVFVTGLEPDFAAENVGYFTSPYPERAKVAKPVIDRINKAVHITLPNGVTRTAKYLGSQGCVTLPVGQSSVSFTPVVVKSQLPDASTQRWPMGDALPNDPLPEGIDGAKVKAAVDAAFEPAAGMTAAFVVTWKGRLIGERYGEGIAAQTPLESWSMGKSLTATLMGVLIRQGVYDVSQLAPIPEWQGSGDPRAKIRIADLLQMSSGLRIKAPRDSDYDPLGTYPDHLYLYTGGVDSFRYAATRPQQWPPGMVGRYRNTDPVLINYLVRLAVEKRGEEYLSFPQRSLFDKIGIRTMVMETDPYGNFLTQGYELASGRDWARLGNLYLQDGVWNGERILPEGFAKLVSTLAPAWEADKSPIYGAFFWLNGDGRFPVPKEAYYMAGAGGQFTLIVPSHDLVVVRLGHYKGESTGFQSFRRALALLMEAVPKRN